MTKSNWEENDLLAWFLGPGHSSLLKEVRSGTQVETESQTVKKCF